MATSLGLERGIFRAEVAGNHRFTDHAKAQSVPEGLVLAANSSPKRPEMQDDRVVFDHMELGVARSLLH